MKLTYQTKIEIEFDTEDELQTCLRNIPCMQAQIGQSSAQSTVKQISASTIQQLGTINEAEKQCIINVLKNTVTKTDAANMLGIQRATLYAKIKEYGIDYETLRTDQI